MKTPWSPPTSNTVHRLMDGDKTACGLDGAGKRYAVRQAVYMTEFCKRHSEMKGCAKCWPAQEVTL